MMQVNPYCIVKKRIKTIQLNENLQTATLYKQRTAHLFSFK